MPLEQSHSPRLLRPREVCKLVGRSRTSLWRDVRAGLFPPPIEIGVNAIAWEASTIDVWLASRPHRTYGVPQPEAA